MNTIAWLMLGNFILMGVALWQIRTATMLVKLLENIHEQTSARSEDLLGKYFALRDKDEHQAGK
jgi:hypothetical protein